MLIEYVYRCICRVDTKSINICYCRGPLHAVVRRSVPAVPRICRVSQPTVISLLTRGATQYYSLMMTLSQVSLAAVFMVCICTCVYVCVCVSECMCVCLCVCLFVLLNGFWYANSSTVYVYVVGVPLVSLLLMDCQTHKYQLDY